jgi:hypothetical protein
MAELSRREQANRQQKLGLVWRNRKKISQIIKDYFCLPFFLLIILWGRYNRYYVKSYNLKAMARAAKKFLQNFFKCQKWRFFMC